MTELERPLLIAAFLEKHGWGDAIPHAFAGDFSPRRYARLTLPHRTSILMDADPEQKTDQFVSISNLLRKYGLRSPEIYEADISQGLVLMEDFGTRNVGALLDHGEFPQPYYRAAAKALALLHKVFDRSEAISLNLPLFNTDLFVNQVELFLDGWFPFLKNRPASDQEREDFRASWRAVLRPVDIMPKSLLLRDFMPDNLMDLGSDTLGILDFQDAGIGPIAYDLASLCESVRRDGGFEELNDVIDTYCHQRENFSSSELMRACIILSAQRHTRIIGIIANHRHRTGRDDKLAFLPRIRTHLNVLLQQPYLFPVYEWMERHDAG